MPKLLVILGAIIIIIIGFFWLNNSPADELADVLDETTLELEDKLDDLSVALRHDDLSPEELLYAQRDIIALLDRIQEHAAAASGQRITTQDLLRVQDSLGRLARILEVYLEDLANLDQQVAAIPVADYPDDIDETERERTILMAAITTITDLTEVATVEGRSLDVLEDTIFDDESGTDHSDQDTDENATDTPSGETAGEAIELNLAPAN